MKFTTLRNQHGRNSAGSKLKKTFLNLASKVQLIKQKSDILIIIKSLKSQMKKKINLCSYSVFL